MKMWGRLTILDRDVKEWQTVTAGCVLFTVIEDDAREFLRNVGTSHRGMLGSTPVTFLIYSVQINTGGAADVLAWVSFPPEGS